MVTLAMAAAQERRRQPVGEEEQDYATLARAGGRKGELATPSLCGLSEAIYLGLVVLQNYFRSFAACSSTNAWYFTRPQNSEGSGIL